MLDFIVNLVAERFLGLDSIRCPSCRRWFFRRADSRSFRGLDCTVVMSRSGDIYFMMDHGSRHAGELFRLRKDFRPAWVFREDSLGPCDSCVDAMYWEEEVLLTSGFPGSSGVH